ncbi:glycosyltransferase family 2 protein [bacterium]|nr:glycosyltransferase family 2 protein [bacterium]
MLKKIVLFVFVPLLFQVKLFGEDTNKQERPLVLIVTSYNNSRWYKKNLDIAFAQKYSNWRMIYIDDCSSDGTGDLVQRYIKENELENKVTLIRNEKRHFKMYNFFHAVHEHCDDQEIVLDYDGDDWFAHDQVLSTVNNAYNDSNVWLTYGSYKDTKNRMGCCRELPTSVVERNAYRDHKWVTSHQRSFYAWLFKKIHVEDFLYEGKFIHAANDLAFMFPMLEMAGGRFKFIRDVLYIYNIISPIGSMNDRALKRYQKRMDRYTRYHRSKYQRLESIPVEIKKEGL